MCFVHALSSTHWVHVGCALPAFPSCPSPTPSHPKNPFASFHCISCGFPGAGVHPCLAGPAPSCPFPCALLGMNRSGLAHVKVVFSSFSSFLRSVSSFVISFHCLISFLGFCISVLNSPFIHLRKAVSSVFSQIFISSAAKCSCKYSFTFLSSLLLSLSLSHAGVRLGLESQAPWLLPLSSE